MTRTTEPDDGQFGTTTATREERRKEQKETSVTRTTDPNDGHGVTPNDAERAAAEVQRRDAASAATTTKRTTTMTRGTRKDRIRRLEADRRALVQAAIESGAGDTQARITAAMEMLIGCGTETIGITIDTDPFDDASVERIEVTGHHARWREWWAEGERGHCRLVLGGARETTGTETDDRGREHKTVVSQII